MLKLKFPLSKSLALALLLALATAVAPRPAASAPDQLNFSLRTADGGEISSEMLRGDVVVLAFGASWLPLSRAQAQAVQDLADQYAERDVRVYWVSTDSDSPKSKNYASDEQLRDFAKRNGLKVAVLRDPEGALFKRLGVAGNQLPAIVILDRTGSVHGQPAGGFNPKVKLSDQLSQTLDRLAAAQ